MSSKDQVEAQRARLRAVGTIIGNAENASAKVEGSEPMLIGYKLLATAMAIKPAHQPGALKIARDYCRMVGIDTDDLERQVGSDIYEAEQIESLEKRVEEA